MILINFKPKFKLTDCGSPVGITNGLFDIKSETKVLVDGKIKNFQQELEYTCSENYATIPSAEKVLTCNGKTGKYEPSLPECLRGKYICVNKSQI